MVIPSTAERRRAGVAAVITVLCLATGCDNPLVAKFGEPDEQTHRDLEKCGLKKPAAGLAAPPGSNPTSNEILQFGRELAKEYGLAIGF